MGEGKNNFYTTETNQRNVSWLMMTAYTHDWLNREFGGEVRLHGKPVLSVAHLPEVRKALRMMTQEDVMQEADWRWAMSAMRMDCMAAGLEIGPQTMERTYHVTSERLGNFVPIECPRMALTREGVLRPWNRMTAFGRSQAATLRTLLLGMFWQAVTEHYSMLVAKGEAPATAIALIKSFCDASGTSEVYLDDLRREWQRRRKK